LIDLDANKLKKASYLGFPEEEITHLNQFELDEETWTPLLFSPQPLVIADISKDDRIPMPWRRAGIGKRRSFIGAPIRAKGIPLGLLSLFRESIQDFSIEDITLLMTIASQIGAIIERNRLIGQAEQAAVLEERQRLARELHDSVTQLLYSQVLFASAGEKSLRHGKVEPAQQYLTRIDQAALQALKEMRILVYELNPQQALSEGLVKALEQRLDAVERRAGIEASIEVTGNIDLDEKNQLNLYRLIQEALNNTLKHSGASSVRINLRQELESLRVKIEDNGSGFNLQEQTLSGGMGLTNMQDRAADLGADLLINSEPGQGTRITLMMKDSP
jgi:signal transduction histidine kinase